MMPSEYFPSSSIHDTELFINTLSSLRGDVIFETFEIPDGGKSFDLVVAYAKIREQLTTWSLLSSSEIFIASSLTMLLRGEKSIDPSS
jgi:hypothetical protein